MSESASPSVRDAGGRFVPGQSGNPAGKAPGTRNRATQLRELMDEGEDRAIGRVVIDKAKAGDAVAARFVVGHLYPRPRARTVALALADGLPANNVVAAHDAVLRALFAGEIAPDEAEAITRVLDARMRALRARGQDEYLMRCCPGFPAMAPLRASALHDEEDEEADEGKGEAEPSESSAALAAVVPAEAGTDHGARRGDMDPGFRKGDDNRNPAVASPAAVRADSPPDRLHSTCIQQGPAAKSPTRWPCNGSS